MAYNKVFPVAPPDWYYSDSVSNVYQKTTAGKACEEDQLQKMKSEKLMRDFVSASHRAGGSPKGKVPEYFDSESDTDESGSSSGSSSDSGDSETSSSSSAGSAESRMSGNTVRLALCKLNLKQHPNDRFQTEKELDDRNPIYIPPQDQFGVVESVPKPKKRTIMMSNRDIG
eukprot:gene1607-1942_t